MRSALLTLLLLMGSFALESNAELLSAYTAVSDSSCVLYDSSALNPKAEIDYLDQECAGLGGYQVMVSGGDLRYPMHLVYNGTKITLSNVGAFHQVGAGQIEWLYERVKGRVTYKALIHRINYADLDTGKDKTMLIVSKLAKESTCPVALVTASADMNKKARVIAEKAHSMSCLDWSKVQY